MAHRYLLRWLPRITLDWIPVCVSYNETVRSSLMQLSGEMLIGNAKAEAWPTWKQDKDDSINCENDSVQWH